MALLKALIPAQRWESVRDRIGAVLSEELTSQLAFHSNPAWSPTVWVDRVMPFDKTELPVANVQFDNGSYSNRDARQVDGNYSFFVDIITNARFTDAERGDVLASKNAQRIGGMVRAILSNPVYRTLGYTPPFNCTTSVTNIQLGFNSEKESDILNTVTCRVTFTVRVPETTELIDANIAGTPVTQIKLYLTDKGYKYGASELLVIDSADLPDADIILAYFKIGGTGYPVFEEFADRVALLSYLNTTLAAAADLDGEFLISGRILYYTNPENYSDAEVMAIISQETTVFRVGSPLGTVQPGLTVVNITNGSPLVSSRLVNIDPAKIQIHIGTQFQEPLTEVWSIDVSTGVITFQPGIIPDNSLVYVNHTQQLIAP